MSLPFTSTKYVELSCPPAHAVQWTFEYTDGSTTRGTVISARTWFEARAAASIFLCIAPELLRGRMGVS
jgi:hypothetical protein